MVQINMSLKPSKKHQKHAISMYIYKNDFNLNLETKKVFFGFFLAFLTQTSNKPKESATNRSKHYSYTNFPMGKQIADFCRTSSLSCESVCDANATSSFRPWEILHSMVTIASEYKRLRSSRV